MRLAAFTAIASWSLTVHASIATRTSAFEYDATTGFVTAEIVEPDNPQLCVRTTYAYDGYGNKTGATTGNCAGASGRAAFATRTSTSSFDPQSSPASFNGYPATAPAGAFATTATNALGQSETRRYNPRFGALIARPA